MNKVILTRGLPASGKSTWAKQYIADNPNTIRTNKDDIRAMAHNSKWNKSNEKQTIRIRDFIIVDAIERGNDVIVDDTNLSDTHYLHIKELVKGKAEVEIKDFTDVTLEECLRRDGMREKPVGRKVILGMYNQFFKKITPLNVKQYPETSSFCVIFDLDGTLACIGDRSPYDGKSCHVDTVNQSVRWLISAAQKTLRNNGSGNKAFILSGRNGDSRPETMQWLKDNSIQYDDLFMREPGDNRKDSIIKKELYEKHIEGKYNVIFIVDDRDQMVDLWRSMGITCLQCNYGSF